MVIRKNIIFSILFVLFGIYIIYFFGIFMLMNMDKPFWEQLPFSLVVFIPVFSGVLLIISGYIFFFEKNVHRNFVFLFWVFSLPLFLYQVMIWQLLTTFSSIESLIDKFASNLFVFISTFTFFFISGFFLIYIGFVVYNQKIKSE